ncbi:MAG: ABC transporter ATP-binding protein [Anaerolineales bacterium]|nr:ABC transporter ATP-binding protein [Anaerolineales bacterium]
MPSPLIQTNNLHRSLPLGAQQLHILRGLTFHVEDGEWIALTGPSGSGKSTLLGLLAGVDRPSSGQLFLEGTDISLLPEKQLARLRNEKIGLVFQAFNLIPTMTALENVAVPLYISPKRHQARQLAREMLARVGLEYRLDHLPHQLSGGEQQRVAIARALVTSPRILLADEPTGNLDSVTGEQVLALITELHKQLNLTVVMVTHDADVARHANRELHMVDGVFVNGSDK